MATLTLAITAVIAATVAIFVDRNIQERKKLAKMEETQEAAAEPAQIETVNEASQGRHMMKYVTSVRNRLTGNKKETAKKFQAWAAVTIEDDQLKAWLTGLSPEATNALMEQLADFCFSLGFELSWLLDENLNQDPEIKQETIAVVTAYCRACWHAAQSYTDFELFKLLQEIEQEPFTRKRQDLSRRLFAELVTREMAASVPAELFLASEKERQEHMAKAIQQAAETDRDAFKMVLKDIVAAEATSATADDDAAQPANDGGKAEAEPSKPGRFFGSGGKGKGRKTKTSASSETIGDPSPSPAPGTAEAEPSAS